MGVLAVYGVPHASRYIYYGLHNIQHRGQEGGGIITFDEKREAYHFKGQGLLSEIFTNGELDHLPGSMGVGSVKYANASKGGLNNVEPLFFHHHTDDFAIAGEGNLVNARQVSE